MTQTIIHAIFTAIPKEWGIFLISLLPIIELRGAIPVGIGLGMNPWIVFLLAVVGNMLPVPFILLFIKKIFDFFRDRKGFGRFVRWLEARSLRKSDKVTKYALFGLCLFVAIPLPMTGAWTGALIAALLEMPFHKSFWSVFAGVVIAGVIMMIASLGAFNLVNLLF